MKSWLYVIAGVVLVLVGLLWVLQGLGTIAGGFMSGQTVWFAIGLLVALAGIASLYAGVRRRATARR
ncbi:MAG TPA: hypothetical protein VHV74_07290 [Pseudonocardiaceae bacterium]|jgi:hypothetical protein|nr:hypothetical protein [Pseudonocardiaceae bacterium]